MPFTDPKEFDFSLRFAPTAATPGGAPAGPVAAPANFASGYSPAPAAGAMPQAGGPMQQAGFPGAGQPMSYKEWGNQFFTNGQKFHIPTAMKAYQDYLDNFYGGRSGSGGLTPYQLYQIQRDALTDVRHENERGEDMSWKQTRASVSDQQWEMGHDVAVQGLDERQRTGQHTRTRDDRRDNYEAQSDYLAGLQEDRKSIVQQLSSSTFFTLPPEEQKALRDRLGALDAEIVGERQRVRQAGTIQPAAPTAAGPAMPAAPAAPQAPQVPQPGADQEVEIEILSGPRAGQVGTIARSKLAQLPPGSYRERN